MIGARQWAIAAAIAVGLHGVALGLAGYPSKVTMEGAAGRPGTVWGLPVETIADVVDLAAEPTETGEPQATDTPETPETPETAETPETSKPAGTSDVAEAVAADTPDALEPPVGPETEPLAKPTDDAARGPEIPAPSSWDGGEAIAAQETETAEPVEPAATSGVSGSQVSDPQISDPRVAALAPIDEAEPVTATDITTPVPRVRPADVPRVAAPPKKPEPAKKTAPQPKAAVKPSPSRSTERAPPAAAPAGEQVGGAGKQQSDGGRQLVSSYAGRVASHLQRHKRYPKEAAARRLSGTATITFTIAANGQVRAARLSRSSGTSAFDREVVAMVDRAAPFPPIPQALGRSTMTFTVPIRFKPR
ncbi:TonB family protein [Microbaculum sp. FT89]|uniref:energy transducer TonB family protein n=1 Tax=Microbaculum sp. FT89 TaxID=3447298 RepID=UPI003F52E12C